jgi:tetratricopeptide (TPR) repeat protein
MSYLRRTPEDADAYYAARYAMDAALPDRAIVEEDRRIADEALTQGDVDTALRALAGAVLVDPFHPETCELVERALDHFDADTHLEHDSEPWLGFEGLRVYADACDGMYAEAVETVLALGQRHARARYLEAWAPEWLASPGVLASLDRDLVGRVLHGIASRFPDPPAVGEHAREVLGAALGLLDQLEAITGPTDATAITRGMMLARAGRLDEAIRVAESAARARPSTMTFTAAAQAHRRAGDLDLAIAWFERAAAHDPKYVPCLLDLGDMCLEAGRTERALAAYEEALRRDPRHDWATPSAAFCRHLLGESAALDALRTMANGARCTCGCAGALASLTGGYSYDDRQARAEYLIRKLEPGFSRAPIDVVH